MIRKSGYTNQSECFTLINRELCERLTEFLEFQMTDLTGLRLQLFRSAAVHVFHLAPSFTVL
ncbi:hypothetical protein NK6_9020 [Bradyrhizobium diazoefficiens]|uniref:Uncharacterized protein n=1 Tax=Bradyrhizobium diazoefficiens TaxID=1355477 RepID=A0A0E4BVQ0_9BRAD|nr:hypothetical protein NK6_9020 [Bradyrhizobium diazoefficiens]